MANYTDYTFRLIELRDGVDSAIHNIKNVIGQQEKLNGIIKGKQASKGTNKKINMEDRNTNGHINGITSFI